MTNTLKGKISLIYGSLLILTALVGFAGFYNLYRLEKAVDSLMTDNYKSINASARMLETIEGQDGAVLTSISIDSRKGSELFMDLQTAFIKWYQVEVNNVTEQGEKKLIEDIGNRYDLYIKDFSELQRIRSQSGEEGALLFYDNTMLLRFNRIKQELAEVSRLNELAMFQGKNLAAAKTKQSMYFLLGLSFTAVIGGYAAARHFVNRFLNPLKQLTESISRVKAGELNQELVLHSNDEAGKLAEEFNRMTKRLQSYEKSTKGQLIAEKNRSMAIVKSISDPLLVLDAEYRIVLTNHAFERFFNLAEPDVLGKHFLEAVLNGEIFSHISDTVRSGAEHREKIFQLHGGYDHYFNVVVVSVKEPENNHGGLIVLFQNVTELKELERVKTDFVATISHEFKTPLTSILMAASMLSDSSLGHLDAEQLEIVETLKDDGEKLANLVNDLLELSRIESGREVYQFALCSLREVVEASAGSFADMAARRGVRMTVDIPEKLPPVVADAEKISWVVNNLIGNALKYTDAGDDISVSAEMDGQSVRIAVMDTGTGIMPEYIDHIFDKFYQARGGEGEARGMGLGLYAAREIVHAHGGGIWVESEPGAGSTFTFTLPL